MLEIRHISKQFGGVSANADISLRVNEGQTHALIGPNGAGKSTLIAQVSGELQADSGQIRFHDQDITQHSTEARSRLGLGRMYQSTALFEEMSVLDNLRIPLLGCDMRRTAIRSWFWRAFEDDAQVRRQAMAMLQKVGMDRHPEQAVSTLSHGEQRQLEMAMTLSNAPTCLLLDEPMAGLGSEESARMIRLIRKLKDRHAILLVEHDMDAVFDLADIISVLVEGRVIATGTVAEIRAHPEVQAAYLGTDSC